MAENLSQLRTALLIFGGITVVATVILVGNEDSGGMLDTATSTFISGDTIDGQANDFEEVEERPQRDSDAGSTEEYDASDDEIFEDEDEGMFADDTDSEFYSDDDDVSDADFDGSDEYSDDASDEYDTNDGGNGASSNDDDPSPDAERPEPRGDGEIVY